MQRCVAFLRGIAPTGTNMTNDKLRAVFDGHGFANVGSVPTSGNITFTGADADGPSLEQRIERALVSGLGVATRTIMRAYPELRALLDSEPLPGLTHGPVTHLTAPSLKKPESVLLVVSEQPGRRTRVVCYDRSLGPSWQSPITAIRGTPPGFMSWLEGSYGNDITTRNWLTVQRVVKKLES
jgi:uncharacterized protein (DUF1697 family)